MKPLTHIKTTVVFGDDAGKVYTVVFKGAPRKRTVHIGVDGIEVESFNHLAKPTDAVTARKLLELSLTDNLIQP